jgi:hypothetical protein
MIFGGPKEWSEYVAAHQQYALSKVKGLIGRDVTILRGKYQGRKAQITSISSFIDGIRFIAQPYNLVKSGELLWDDAEARTYRKYDEIDWN